MKSFIKDNIMEILAIGGVLQFLIVSLLILFRAVKASDNTTIMILTSSTMIATTVLNFYFGSSKGSKDKQIKIDELENKKNENTPT
jgi:uncharacterized membrane protein